MPWHVIPVENLKSILNEGLTPRLGPRSELVNEDMAAVHLFKTVEDMEDAGWLEDVFGEDEKLALLYVAWPNEGSGAWVEVGEPIPPARIQLITPDFDSWIPTAAHRKLDEVDNPFGSLEDFRATRFETTGEIYGQLVGDGAYEGDQSPMLVYGAQWRIERQGEDIYILPLETTEEYAQGDLGLRDLEAKLFDYARMQAADMPDSGASAYEP